jgi:hypothetical protein
MEDYTERQATISLSIRLFAMRDAQNEDSLGVVIETADQAEVANTIPPQPGLIPR